ncbi:MAG: uroporphyrinogen-III C-methyltransferase [Eubacteriales bacterium]|nr:uroporphyrinogen-III C-methyltransferase [Eubacteriales bacterium]
MGKVYLVGAGPGGKDLITVKGLRLIREAEVVIYDSLIEEALLEETKTDCEQICVGKRMGKHSVCQDEINNLLLREAKTHETVVRLKGGDPFVFGRGGEEAMTLIREGIDFEVVPGVTSAAAVPAHAGIPVTHRGIARCFHVITGHTCEDAQNYGRYAGLPGTLVFLMGLHNIEKISEDLIAGGMSGDIHAAVISEGFSRSEKVVRAPLSEIAKAVRDADLKAPAVIVIGETAGMDLRALKKQDRECGIVGTKSFASGMRQELAKRGISSRVVLEMKPVISENGRNALIAALRGIERYRWISFSSRNAVDLFFDVADEIGFDRKRFSAVKFAAIGPATAASLKVYNIPCDLIPGDYTGTDMAEALVKSHWESAGPALVIRAEEGSADMFRVLDGAGVEYEKIELYKLVSVKPDFAPLIGPGSMVVLASASGVRAFFEEYGGELKNDVMPSFACIGGYTARQLECYGIKPAIVASEHTTEGLACAIKRCWLKEGVW